jgi:RNA polymerase sigma-70 factor (ECF subfamily)
VTRAHDVGEVVAEHGDFLWKTLQRCGVRDADLADVLQEVLIVVHRQLATYDPARPMPPWLFGICLRVAVAHRRRAWVRRERPVAEAPDGPDGGPDPEEQASRGQARARLAAILEAMDPERRAVFVMFEIEELGCEQIAAIVGVPVGTVWSRLHVARREFDEVRARLQAREPRGAWR